MPIEEEEVIHKETVRKKIEAKTSLYREVVFYINEGYVGKLCSLESANNTYKLLKDFLKNGDDEPFTIYFDDEDRDRHVTIRDYGIAEYNVSFSGDWGHVYYFTKKELLDLFKPKREKCYGIH